MYQRHTSACPRGSTGELIAHRCRGRWGYVIDAGRRPDGGRRQFTRSGFATKRVAEDALRQELARQAAGLADLQGQTVSEFLDRWLAGKRRLRATTRRGYAGHIRRYLRPGLGHYRLTDLRPHHLDTFYDEMLRNGRSSVTVATVHDVHRTLRSALNLAVKRRLIPWNPSLHVELPERVRPKTQVWAPDDLGRFLESTSVSRWYPLFHTIAFTGMRRGEALGLHWSDVDLAAGHVVITSQLVDAGEGPQLGEPKTRAGARIVPIDALTVTVLKDRNATQQAERDAWGPAWQDHGLVFTREDGSPVRPDYATRLFGRLSLQAGVPRIRLHDLRHTHASLALLAGVDIKVISARLGHSTTTITADLYTHVIPIVARRAADSIASVIPQIVPREQRDVSEALARGAGAAPARSPPAGESAGQQGWPGAGSNRRPSDFQSDARTN